MTERWEEIRDEIHESGREIRWEWGVDQVRLACKRIAKLEQRVADDEAEAKELAKLSWDLLGHDHEICHGPMSRRLLALAEQRDEARKRIAELEGERDEARKRVADFRRAILRLEAICGGAESNGNEVEDIQIAAERVVLLQRDRDSLLRQIWGVAYQATERAATNAWDVSDKGDYVVELLEAGGFDVMRVIPEEPASEETSA